MPDIYCWIWQSPLSTQPPSPSLIKYNICCWSDLIKDVATRETSQHYEPEERQDATDVARCLNVWVSRAECGVAWCRGPLAGPAWPHPPPTTSNTCEVQRSQWDHTFQLGNISTVSPPPTSLSQSWQSWQILLNTKYFIQLSLSSMRCIETRDLALTVIT